MMRTCSPNSVPRYMHSGPKGKAGPCVLRESPTGRVIIVIVAEREERREKREEKREEKRREEKEKRREEKRREEKRREEKREKRREKRREEKRREEKRREEKRREEKEREWARETEKAENPSVCAVRTSPCVRGKRPHVLNMRAVSTTDRDLETKT